VNELDEALAAGRAAAEELMRDTITLYRPGPDVFDRETGQTIPGAPAVTFYSGKARVKAEQVTESEVQAGEQEVVLRRYTVTLPYSTRLPSSGERPAPGDVVEVSASLDQRLVGLRLRVTGVQYSGTATAWRISVEDRS
jgi:hypothetical protein